MEAHKEEKWKQLFADLYVLKEKAIHFLVTNIVYKLWILVVIAIFYSSLFH